MLRRRESKRCGVCTPACACVYLEPACHPTHAAPPAARAGEDCHGVTARQKRLRERVHVALDAARVGEEEVARHQDAQPPAPAAAAATHGRADCWGRHHDMCPGPTRLDQHSGAALASRRPR